MDIQLGMTLKQSLSRTKNKKPEWKRVCNYSLIEKAHTEQRIILLLRIVKVLSAFIWFLRIKNSTPIVSFIFLNFNKYMQFLQSCQIILIKIIK